MVEENWVGCGCEIDRSFLFGLGLPEWDPRDLGSGCMWGGGGANGKVVVGAWCDVFVDRGRWCGS